MIANQRCYLRILLTLCAALCMGLAACQADEDNTTTSDTTSDATSDTQNNPDSDDTSDTSDAHDTDMTIFCDAIAVFCYPCDGATIGQEPTYVECDAQCPEGFSQSCEYEQYPLCDESIAFVCCGPSGAKTPRCPLGNNPTCLPGETSHPNTYTCQAQNAPDCPEGPQSPLGETCDSTAYQDTHCAYGYETPECGGRTVTCEGNVWVEVEHTDPQPSCLP